MGDLVVFSGLEDSRIGHVGFLSRPLGAPDPEGGSKKGVWIIGGNQKAKGTVNEEKGTVSEEFYPASHPTLEILDIVKTTNFSE